VPRLELALLGSPHIVLDGAPVKVMDKVLALLAYLAVESQDAHRRDMLVGLLWPDLSEAAARNNLRVTLHRLRQALCERPGAAGFLQISRDTLQWCRTSDYWLDIAAVGALLQNVQPPSCAADAAQLAEVLRLYRGDFLKDFFLEDSVAFEEWASMLRERLRQQALKALTCLTDWYLAHGDYTAALAHARRQIELEAWNETAHQQLMLALTYSGQRVTALAHYEALCRILDDELATQPSAETVALYQRLRSCEIEPAVYPPAAPAAPLLTTYAPLTPFIGREAELARLAELLAQPTCRLVTLLGPGGIGKTRLALAAATTTSASREQVCFVPLVDVETPEFMLSAIVSALAFDFSRADDLRARLLLHLRDRQLLLVLDNFEHLLARSIHASELLVDILYAAPGVTMLVTSREPLNLQAEVIVDVGGLAVPETETTVAAGEHSAVQLFVDRASRVQAGFTLSAASQPWVIRICGLLEGMPLGIELAAAWVRVSTCDAIYQQLQRNLDFLSTSRHDMPKRHRSLRAIFDHSWDLLATEEQAALRGLAIFRGGFAEPAAAQVADAPLTVLLALLNKSLLRQTPTGRYELHELVRQYAEEKLREHPATCLQLQARHARYYAAFLQEREAGVRSLDKLVTQAIADEMPNIRASWHWAATQRQLTIVEPALAALFTFFDTQSRYDEGLEVLEPVEAALQELSGAADAAASALFGNVLACRGVLYHRLSRYTESRDRLSRGLNLLRRYGSWSNIAFALLGLGWADYLTARYTEAQTVLEECLALYQTHDEPAGIGQSMYLLGFVCYELGDFARAQQLCAEGLEHCRADGYELAAQHCIYGLGLVARALGDYDQARRCHEENLTVCRAAGFRWGMVWALHNLGLIAYRQAAYTAAEQLVRDGLAIAQSINCRWSTAYGLNTLAIIEIALGRDTEALACAEESLALYTEIDDMEGIGVASGTLGVLADARGDQRAAEYFRVALHATIEAGALSKALEILVGLAVLLIGQGKIARAVDWLTLVRDHPATHHWHQERAAQLLVELAASPSKNIDMELEAPGRPHIALL
jgi:predicted ATPase/DNA-binding SARP family transcriptional activator